MTRAIDILYFDATSGHRSAANALASAFARQHPAVEPRPVNLTELLDGQPALRALASGGIDLFNWGMRREVELLPRHQIKAFQVLQRALPAAAHRAVSRFWRRRRVDAVVSVTPICNRFVQRALHHARPGCPYVIVPVDFEEGLRRYWFDPETDAHHLVPSARLRAQALAAGVDPARVTTVPGMPIDPDFYDAPAADRAAALTALGLDPALRTVLVCFGGQGSVSVETCARALRQLGADLNVIFLCGRDRAVRVRVERLRTPYRKAVLGFTQAAPALLRARRRDRRQAGLDDPHRGDRVATPDRGAGVVDARGGAAGQRGVDPRARRGRGRAAPRGRRGRAPRALRSPPRGPRAAVAPRGVRDRRAGPPGGRERRAAAGSAAATVIIPSAKARVRLPSGVEVVCRRKEEALLVYGEVGSYVRHGMALAPGAVIFDVGANIGLFSLWAREACGRDATIYAFEPVPAIHAMLAENFRGVGDARLHAINAGLSSRAGRATFAYHPNATFASTAFPEDGDLALTETLLARSLDTLPPPLHLTRHLPGPLRRVVVRGLSRIILHREPVECALTTVSDVIRARGVTRVDFLKVDAEKAELDVLQGIDDAHWPMIRQAFVEVHDRDGRVDTVRALFEAKGFSRVVTEQEEFFRGTDIHAVSAIR
ncbi:MAG: FkbM family methyltransferase [Polyangiales bacterium]